MIKNLPQAARPLYKLLCKGSLALSDNELLAILLRLLPRRLQTAFELV